MELEDGGGHDIILEGDLVVLVVRGPLLLPHATLLREHVDRVLSASRRCYLLADVRQMTTMDGAARRFLGEWGRASKLRTVTAVFGMSFGVRVLAMLLLNAIRVMGRTQNLTRLFDDEAEARAFLAEYRRSVADDDGAQGSG